MSDGSFPHPIPEPGSDEEAETEPGGQVVDFPADESGAWGADADRSHDGELLRPASFEVERGGELVVFPRSASTAKRRRVADASGEQPTQEPTPPRPDDADELEVAAEDRPKYLASELLREDLTPEAPLRRTLRASSAAIGILGAIGAILIGGTGAVALAVAGVFGAIALVGFVPLRPQHRGVALALLGAGGAALGAYPFGGEAIDLSRPLMVGCVVLTSGGLFFRAAHRSSRLARILVGLGLGTTALWLALTGGLDAMVVERMAWDAWLVPASRLLLVGVGLVGVLTFLDPRGSGGAWATGAALLVWLALESGARIALTVQLGAAPEGVLLDPALLPPSVLPLLSALAAGGLCQSFVWATRRA